MVSVVTELKIQSKNKNRTNVYLDGEFGFGIANTLALTLHTGQELSEKQVANLIKKDEFEAAFLRADHFMGYKPRTSGEVTRKLLLLKYNSETVKEVIEKLTEQNLLDDKRFAAQWVEERSSFKPKSRKVLAMELKQKNVDPEIIQEALVSLDNEGLAVKAAHEYAQKLKETDWAKFRSRISGFLVRRGFEYSDIAPAVAKVWAEKNYEK
jgi:regulatory protein